jgi:hypothetical protein
MTASYSKCWKTEKMSLKKFLEFLALTTFLNIEMSKFVKAI